jgi:transposase
MEATGYSRWFERLLAELGFEVWMGDPAEIKAKLLELLDRMNPTIEELTAAVEREARKRPEALRLMTRPGVGPLTGMVFSIPKVSYQPHYHAKWTV